MNQQDLNELTENWGSETSWLNDKVDEMFKAAQDHAYALGLKRGLTVKQLSDEEIMVLAKPFGEFQFEDAQGHKRIEFAQAVIAAARAKQ